MVLPLGAAMVPRYGTALAIPTRRSTTPMVLRARLGEPLVAVVVAQHPTHDLAGTRVWMRLDLLARPLVKVVGEGRQLLVLVAGMPLIVEAHNTPLLAILTVESIAGEWQQWLGILIDHQVDVQFTPIGEADYAFECPHSIRGIDGGLPLSQCTKGVLEQVNELVEEVARREHPNRPAPAAHAA